jgi:broad specificity phosphatase PhoE
LTKPEQLVEYGPEECMIIKLVRHGESEQNTGVVNATEIGDFNVALSPKGWAQARSAGEQIGAYYLGNALVYVSPYRRTRQTLTGIIDGSNVLADYGTPTIYEDIRLREVEFGFNKANKAIEIEQELRAIHGWMFYRYQGGESPADCYDRICSFLESMVRQVERKKIARVLIVSHGLTIRCFVTRFLHLSVEEFDKMRNPGNGDIITIGDKNLIENAVFTRGKWAVNGLKVYDRS